MSWRGWILAGIVGAAHLNLAFATEPLHDRVTVGGLSGVIYQAGTGWLPLPPSDRVRELARSQSCTAIGGPRGVYQQRGDGLWLVSLHTCGGELPLREVYPAAPSPWLADWIDGEVVARLGKVVCRMPDARSVYERELTFVVRKGIVQSRREEAHDARACRPGGP